jgi:putative transposase
MSWVRIWIHLVFCTKNRELLLEKNIRSEVFQHIKQNASHKDIYIDSVNGYSDHCHCMISLGKEQTISKVVQLIKGESSYWINKNNLCNKQFIWQDDYWGVSVSESHLKQVRNYIFDQEEHHIHKTFAEEIDKFMKKYGWQYIQG